MNTLTAALRWRTQGSLQSAGLYIIALMLRLSLCRSSDNCDAAPDRVEKRQFVAQSFPFDLIKHVKSQQDDRDGRSMRGMLSLKVSS